MTVYKLVHLNPQNILQNCPPGSIVDVGGTSNATFTVGGRGILFDDGSSTGGTSALTLQNVYDRSLDAQGNASIKLTTGKSLVFYDDTNNAVYFKVDANTGKVTITGDLEVLGSSSIINTTIQDSDHWVISPASAITTSLKIEPEFTTPVVDVVNIKNISGGAPVFRIDKDGNTFLKTLNVSNGINIVGNIVISGLVDGYDVSLLGDTVAQQASAITNLTTTLNNHITSSATQKHYASEIRVNPPPGFDSNATNVQAVIDSLTDVLAGIGSGGGGSSTPDSGIFVTDVVPTSSGIVGNKIYVANTVPANAVLQRASTDNNNVRIHFLAEGNSAFYSPTVLVDTIPGPGITPIMTEHPTDKRMFVGYADIVVGASRVITLTSSVGVSTSVEILRAAAGPSINALVIGALPGSQTSVKLGDVVAVSGSVENSASYVEVYNAMGASGGSSPFVLTLGAADSAGSGYKTFSGTFTVGSGSGNQRITARARNTLGTYGADFISTNTIALDQAAPVIGTITVIYPASQSALKLTEFATVSAGISDFTSVAYTSTSDLAISSPSDYAVTKSVVRNGGSYVDSGTNYTITAYKSSNATSSSSSSLVKIANVPPTASIVITGNPTRLISSPAGITYTITLTSTQNLRFAPTVTASSGSLSTFSGSGKVWTASLIIHDTDSRGAQSFNIVSMTNDANINGTIITSGQNYTVGGFTLRQVTFPAFARYAQIAVGVNITDITKVTARYAGTSNYLTFYPDTIDHFQGFSIVNSSGIYDQHGTHLFLSDAAFAGSNTTGTLVVEVQEVA